MKTHTMKSLLWFTISAMLVGCISLTPQLDLNNAAISGDVSEVVNMLNQGAHINEKAKTGHTTLHFAAMSGHRAVVETLLDRGADVNARDNTGNTPLHSALLAGHEAAAELLIARGADVNVTNTYGWTPMFLAKGKGFKNIEMLIISKGAGSNITNNAGVISGAGANDLARPIPKEQEVIVADPAEEARFEKTAQNYRNAAKKPSFPEEARKFKVQAEAAVRDKAFAEAAALYGKALEIAPWWPEGHFNRAAVLSESGSYLGAIREMKRYLALVPNAPNARAAQDKIYDWERRAQK